MRRAGAGRRPAPDSKITPMEARAAGTVRRRRRRVWTLSSVTGLLALAFASPSLAADTPELQVIPYVTGIGRPADTELDLTIPANSAAAAQVVAYAPTGYTANLTQAAGTKIADVTIRAALAGTTLTLKGQAVADAPANHADEPCAPGLHAAVWLIQLRIQTQTLTLPMYVDPTSGSETALGAYRLGVCFPSPDVPQALGGAPLGARIVEADIDFVGSFTNPSSAGLYIWRALVTPYAMGSGTPNTAATYELRSIAFIPVVFTIKARFDRRKRVATFTGRLVLAGVAPRTVAVALVGGATRDASKWKVVGVGRGKKGTFTLRKKLKRSTYVAGIVPPESEACFDGQASLAPAGCTRETTAPVFSNIVRVVVRK